MNDLASTKTYSSLESMSAVPGLIGFVGDDIAMRKYDHTNTSTTWVEGFGSMTYSRPARIRTDVERTLEFALAHYDNLLRRLAD